MAMDRKEMVEKVNISLLRYGVVFGAAMTSAATKDIPGIRNHLPEPFDIPDHMGNINGSAPLGYLAGLLAGRYLARNNRLSVGKMRIAMGAAGLAVGAVINGMAETRFGVNLFLAGNTSPDMVDWAYGAGVATLAAAFGPVLETTPHRPVVLDDVDQRA